jgi:hypothetical protein
MPSPDSHPSGFSLGRRWLTTFNLLLATVAALALVVMFNYLAAGYFKRFPWAEATNFKLSPATLSVVKSLTNDVTITLFYERKADVYTMISALLAEYQNANPKYVHVGDLDYIRSPVEALDLRGRLHLDQAQKDFVAFECKSNGQHQICTDSKLSDFNWNDVLRNQPIRRTAFLGELYFTSAILAVSHPVDQRAYFLTGHGERNPNDSPDASGAGYTNLAAILTNELACSWTNLTLTETDSIPADCKLLIIASSREKKANLSSNELGQIRSYLQKPRNGRLLALLDYTEGLETVLDEWGVRLAPFHVIDQDPRILIGGGEFLASPAMDTNGSIHPIIMPLVRDDLSIHMLAPHPIGRSRPPSKDPGDPTLAAVAATGPRGSAWPAEAGVPTTNYTLIAAIEQGVINGLGGTRIVVAGDSDFLDDQMISQAANHYFASQTLDWLLQRPSPLRGGIGPRPIKEYQLFMTRSQTTQLRWVFLAAMPGSVLFLGGLVWLRRRT